MKHPEFARKFKQAVAMAGVDDTQRGLSKLLGVSEVMIWSYRNGEKLPRMSTATRIASELGVSVAWLLSDAPMPMSVEETPAVYEKKAASRSHRKLIEMINSLSEDEKKDAIKILQLTFKKR